MSEHVNKKQRKHKRGSGKDRVLAAYVDILLADGVAAATLDEVARQAEISKGGLLHHFPSKEDLNVGLMDLLVALNEADIERTVAQGNDLISAYLTSSSIAQDEYSSVFMAALKLAGSNIPEVDRTLQQVLQSWHQTLLEHLPDPALAKIVHLIGDGLYLHAIVGSNPGNGVQELIQALEELSEHKTDCGEDA